MADWLSYSIQDFVPLSLETFLRLNERYGQRFDLVVAAGAALGIASILLLLRAPGPGPRRFVLAAVGLGWLWIAWAYQIETLAPLLWAAELFALAFALQSGLLLAAAALPWKLSAAAPCRDGRGAAGFAADEWIGYGMLVFAVLALPMIALAAGRTWHGVSVFGTGPDATAIATLGVAMLMPTRQRLLLMPVPVLWCLLSALLQRALGDPLWVLPALAVAGFGAAVALIPLVRKSIRG